jgi:hypothetical protein
MGRFSTFQATTVKATGIYSFFILFLRSSRSAGRGLFRVQAAHITTGVSHKEICRVRGRFAPRIEQMVRAVRCAF